MRILHTADWHLGARLVERDRLSEHATFLDWLIDTLRAERIDLLLVSGDIFDSANPPQEAVALYFDFIRRLADMSSVQTVITGGNHDSAAQLNAPRELLKRFRVQVFGAASEDGIVDAGDVVVAAVPFLRERDLRAASAAETAGDAQSKLRAAIQQHYATQLARSIVIAQGRPLIAMGHLTVMGASTSDSERDIHIGNLGAVGADIFDGFAYTALGHLHRPQRVAKREHVRYSGSPVALSFSEANDAKSVVIIETAGAEVKEVCLLPVPCTRVLHRAIVDRADLASLSAVPADSWAEITVNMEAPEVDLDRIVREAAAGRFEVLKVIAAFPCGTASAWQHSGPRLNELKPREVFQELLKQQSIDEPELTDVFNELLALHEAATLA